MQVLTVAIYAVAIGFGIAACVAAAAGRELFPERWSWHDAPLFLLVLIWLGDGFVGDPSRSKMDRLLHGAVGVTWGLAILITLLWRLARRRGRIEPDATP
ncbi:hypothetical protein GCM10023145_38950 [Angustibacter luteus]